jgi:phosphatidylglycerol lysyltransferase
LPFQRADDKRWFVGPDGDSVIAYGVAGRVAVVLGDPIGDDAAAWSTFERFLASCRAHRFVPVVYQATSAGRLQLEAMGFRCIPVGREAILDLENFGLSGSRRANLRHTVTRAQRGRLRTRWWGSGLGAADIGRFGPALAAIDALWRASAGPQMGFTIGSFDVERLARTPIAIACDEADVPVAFATFAPTGADDGWVLDLMRRRPGSVPGALEWCIATAAAELRALGAPTLSLGLVPLWGLDPAADLIEERLLARSVALAAPFYDVAGLAFFKAKFDPRWEARYAAVLRTRDLPALILGLLKLHLVPPGRSILSVALGSIGRD